LYSKRVIPRVLLVSLAVACGSSEPPDRSVEAPGEFSVGTTRLDVGRAIQVWYPTASAPTEIAIESLEPEPVRSRYADLLAAAPACPTRRLEVALDGEISPGSFPLVVGSHCHSGTRLSNASSAIRLASHGFVVVTIDHAGDLSNPSSAGRSRRRT
jgi:predicted dienelactone hydrolase